MKQLGLVFSILAAGVVLSSCLQTNNSFSNDRALFSKREGSRWFVQVKSVMQENCQRCHADFMSWSQDDFLRNKSSLGTPMVVAADPEHSEFYLRLQGAGPRGNMPQNGSLSEASLKVIHDWIQNLDASVPVEIPPYVRPPMDSVAQRLAAARGIFNRSGSCITCHARDISVYTEAEFQNKTTLEDDPFVVPGQPMDSGLYKHLRGAGPAEIADMPEAPRAPLPAEDISVIKEWIERMLPASSPPPPPPPPPPQNPGVLRFQAAKAVIQEKCMRCHSEFDIQESEFVSDGWVEPGSPDHSMLFVYIRGATGPDEGSMPPRGAPLGAEQIALLKAWINGIPRP